MEFFALFIFIVGTLGIVIFYYYQEQKRGQIYQHWVKKNSGWTYTFRSNDLNIDLLRHYQFLEPLREGSNRYVSHILEGRWGGYPSRAFTFHYENYSSNSEGGTQTNHHYLSIVLIHVSKFFPRLSLRPANLLEKTLGSVFNVRFHKSFGFLPKEFTRIFIVDSRDEKFTQRFCNQDIVQFFMLMPFIHFEINQDVLVIYQPGRLKIEKLESDLKCLCRIYELGILRQVRY